MGKKYKRKRQARLDARIADYQTVPQILREGFKKPGSLNRKK
jgi:hypothetical protein